MKKYAVGILALIMALSMVSCGSDKDESDKDKTSAAAAESGAEETPEEDDPSPYTMLADFSKGESSKFIPSDGWSNGSPFDCSWTKNNVTFEDGKMQLIIDKNYFDEYTGGEYRSNDFYGYGLYEVSMKAIKNPGVVSSFFTYTGPTDGNPWDEIDIEFLGKNTTKVQFNYYTDGKGNHEYLYDLGFDASEEFHEYGFEWKEDSITWYVDGQAVYTATENLPSTPGKLMMNAWNGKGVDGWLSKFDGTVPLTAEYQWARFTAAEGSDTAAETPAEEAAAE